MNNKRWHHIIAISITLGTYYFFIETILNYPKICFLMVGVTWITFVRLLMSSDQTISKALMALFWFIQLLLLFLAGAGYYLFLLGSAWNH